MSMVISRPECLSSNVKSVLKYLDKQFPNYDFDVVEEDIRMGFVDLNKELFNAYKTLTMLKEKNKNNQKMCTAINNYLKMLTKENIKIN